MPDVVDQASLIAYRCFNALAPRQLSKGLSVTLDFSAAGSNGRDIIVDLELVETSAQLEFVQSVFIDNTLSGVDLRLTAQLSLHGITIAAGRQGFCPIMAPEKVKFLAAVTGIAAADINIQFLNFPVPAYVW